MNAGILTLQDGTPCIAFDERLPYPIRHVEFNPADHRLTLIYLVAGASKISAPKQGKKFDFPLDDRFLNLLRLRGDVAVARIDGKQLVDLAIYPVVFLT